MSNLDLDRLNHIKKFNHLPSAEVLRLKEIEHDTRPAWDYYKSVQDQFDEEDIPSVLAMNDFPEKDLFGENNWREMNEV